jgi:hypothetical protein
MAMRQGSLLPAVPDRSTLKGKRDYVILAPMVAVLPRWNELVEFDVATIRLLDGRWVLAGLEARAGASALSPPYLGQPGYSAPTGLGSLSAQCTSFGLSL